MSILGLILLLVLAGVVLAYAKMDGRLKTLIVVGCGTTSRPRLFTGRIDNPPASREDAGHDAGWTSGRSQGPYPW